MRRSPWLFSAPAEALETLFFHSTATTRRGIRAHNILFFGRALGVGLLPLLRRRYLDILASVYIYNEHRGYKSIDRVLAGVREKHPQAVEFIATIEQHRRDERSHYLMFRRYFESLGAMPFEVDNTCGHIDRLIRLTFGCGIDDLDTQEVINNPELFDRMCRVIMLTEMRGMRQVEILLRSRLMRSERALLKIFRVIERDEPSHWAPYEGWLRSNGGTMPSLAERLADAWVHRSLILFKLPLLYLNPWLRRRITWQDDLDADTLQDDGRHVRERCDLRAKDDRAPLGGGRGHHRPG